MAITELDIGGAEQAFVRVADGLKRRGWDVRVISLRNAGALAGPLQAVGIPVVALNCGGFLDLRAVCRMRAELKKHPADALLTFLHQANIAGRLAGCWAKVPWIVSGIRVADRRWSVRISERLTSRCVDHYSAVSESVARTHRDLCRISTERMTVIRNGVDVDAIQSAVPTDRATLGCETTDIIVLSVGRLSQQKAPLEVLQAFKQFRLTCIARGKRARLLFVGDGPLREVLQTRINAAGLQNEVRVLGWRPDVWGLMRSSDVLVLASHWEGLPNVILESQAAGLLVVASDVDGCSEVISDKFNGRLFPSGDCGELARILLEVTDSQVNSAAMTAAAKRLVDETFQWETCIEKFHAMLTRR